MREKLKVCLESWGRAGCKWVKPLVHHLGRMWGPKSKPWTLADKIQPLELSFTPPLFPVLSSRWRSGPSSVSSHLLLPSLCQWCPWSLTCRPFLGFGSVSYETSSLEVPLGYQVIVSKPKWPSSFMPAPFCAPCLSRPAGPWRCSGLRLSWRVMSRPLNPSPPLWLLFLLRPGPSSADHCAFAGASLPGALCPKSLRSASSFNSRLRYRCLVPQRASCGVALPCPVLPKHTRVRASALLAMLPSEAGIAFDTSHCD